MPTNPSPQPQQELADLLEAMRRHTRMYLLEERFSVLVAYLDGYAAGSGELDQAHFSTWLAARLGLSDETSFGWSGRIQQARTPADAEDLTPLTELDDAAQRELMDDTFALLIEYLRDPNRSTT